MDISTRYKVIYFTFASLKLESNPRCVPPFLQWQGETQEFCPNAKVVLVGCKLDMRTDVNTLRELSKQRLIPVTHEQVSPNARWLWEEEVGGGLERRGGI